MSDRSLETAGIRIHPPAFFGGMLGLLLIYKAFDLPSPLPKRGRLLGIPLVLLGSLVGASGVRAQLKAGTTPDPDKPVSTLVESGPYRFTRNPMYLGMGLMIAGAAFLLNAVWGVLLAPAFILTIDRGQVRREEGYLERKFGDDYRQYKQRVRRWL